MNDKTPLIVVLGPPDAGITTFIQTICQSAVRWIDYHHTEEDGATCNWLGFEGKLYFESDILILGELSKHYTYCWDFPLEEKPVLGFIILCDSADYADFRVARSMAEVFRVYSPHPYIIAANKQDHPNAVSASDLRIIFKVSDEVPVVPCVATDRDSVKRVVITLLEHILESATHDE